MGGLFFENDLYACNVSYNGPASVSGMEYSLFLIGVLLVI